MMGDNPHAPQKLTWQVSSINGEVIWSTSKIAPPFIWWPTLTPDFCQLVAGMDKWDIPTLDPHNIPLESGKRFSLVGNFGCRGPVHRCKLRKLDFYVCPRDGRDQANIQRCGGIGGWYCATWGCETTGDVYWKPSSSWDWIKVHKNYTSLPIEYTRQNAGSCSSSSTCIPLQITFTDRGRTGDVKQWLRGRACGLQWYFPDRVMKQNPGASFVIQLKIENPPAKPIGPNKVLSEQKPLAPVVPVTPKRPPNVERPTTPGSPLTSILSFPNNGQRLLNLIQGAFKVINGSQPNMTRSCWLCLSAGPPYYEGIATFGTFNNTTSQDACTWNNNNRLTLTEVSGRGICVGNPPTAYKHLCNHTLKSPKTSLNRFLVPEIDKWWACSSGLSSCISTSVFDETTDYCVLVQLVPRVYYHPLGTLEHEFEMHPRLFHREPVSLTLAVILGLGVATGVGTGTVALVQTPQYFHELRAAIDVDLKALEQSKTSLADSLTSLSEVVLQNRRGLDLLFLREG